MNLLSLEIHFFFTFLYDESSVLSVGVFYLWLFITIILYFRNALYLFTGHTVRLLGQKKVAGKKAGGAPLDLPKIRKNPLIEIIAINTG